MDIYQMGPKSHAECQRIPGSPFRFSRSSAALILFATFGRPLHWTQAEIQVALEFSKHDRLASGEAAQEAGARLPSEGLSSSSLLVLYPSRTPSLLQVESPSDGNPEQEVVRSPEGTRDAVQKPIGALLRDRVRYLKASPPPQPRRQLTLIHPGR